MSGVDAIIMVPRRIFSLVTSKKEATVPLHGKEAAVRKKRAAVAPLSILGFVLGSVSLRSQSKMLETGRMDDWMANHPKE